MFDNLPENWSLLAAVGTTFILALVLIVWIRRRKARSIDGRLSAASQAVLRNFLIPDGDSGEIHIEYALLTARGILVLDLKNVQGHVFGSDAMQDWTVIDGQRRFTFKNPQNALFDRVAAVRRIAPNVPVEGYVAFLPRAKFTKGQPDHVVIVDQLLKELEHEQRTGEKVLEAFFPSWEVLQEEAVVAQVGRLMRE